MKLLIVTQTVDREDPVLGFFESWVRAFSLRFERIEVVCLREGAHSLPSNVRVHSLGKEKGVSRLRYLFNFYRYAIELRNEYDAVFVHMNEEYVLLGGLLWKMLGKKVCLWRNHYAGTWRTALAAAFADTVFYTSRHSYTARFNNAVRMPVGIDRERFREDPSVVRAARSILFLARMAPAKRPEMLIDALGLLKERGISFTATFVGSPLPEHEAFYQNLIARAHMLGLGSDVRFLDAVSNRETPRLYQSHELFVNASPSGMFDKTLFEAAACGAVPLAASADWAAAAGRDLAFADAEQLAVRLKALLHAGPDELRDIVRRLAGDVVEPNSLDHLAADVADAVQ